MQDLIGGFTNPGLALLPIFFTLLSVPFLFLLAGRWAQSLLFGPRARMKRRGEVLRAFVRHSMGVLPFCGFAAGLYMDVEIFNARGTHIPTAMDLVAVAQVLSAACLIRIAFGFVRFLLELPRIAEANQERIKAYFSVTRNPSMMWWYGGLALVLLALMGILPYLLLAILCLALVLMSFALKEPLRDLLAGLYQMLFLRLQRGTRLANEGIKGRLVESGLFFSVLRNEQGARAHANSSVFFGPLIADVNSPGPGAPDLDS